MDRDSQIVGKNDNICSTETVEKREIEREKDRKMCRINFDKLLL